MSDPKPIPYRGDYLARFAACDVDPARMVAVDALVERLLRRRTRYEAVQHATGVPWWFVAVVHALEAGLSFDHHLHNGDPLSARTVHVPRGRPAVGDPPFTWEASAADALANLRAPRWTDWSLAGALYRLEAFNGFGYRHLATPIPSPYLWAASNQYVRGKYTSDGRYDPTAVSHQIGGAVVWKRMQQRGLITFPEPTTP